MPSDLAVLDLPGHCPVGYNREPGVEIVALALEHAWVRAEKSLYMVENPMVAISVLYTVFVTQASLKLESFPSLSLWVLQLEMFATMLDCHIPF